MNREAELHALRDTVAALHLEMYKRGIKPESAQGQMLMLYLAIKNRWFQRLARIMREEP